jgi:hypothetical protein
MGCAVEGCDRPKVSLGMCSPHHQRLKKFGDPLHGGPLKPYAPRQGKFSPGKVVGELTLTEKVRDGKAWVCTCSCGATTTVTTTNFKKIRTCGDREKHYPKAEPKPKVPKPRPSGRDSHLYGKTGELSPAWRGEGVTYAGLHQRIARERGRASEFDCVDCAGKAQEWSYDGSDPNEKRDAGMAYSLDTNRYEPRCAPCHRTHDGNRSGY